MNKLAIATTALLSGLVALAVAFGHVAATPSATTIRTIAGPPAGPCSFPDRGELNQLAGASDLAVDGAVEGPAQIIYYSGVTQAFTRYSLRVSSVLRGSTSSSVLTLEEPGGVVAPIMKPGPVIAFLTKSDRTDGLTTYFLTNGLVGVFLLRQAGATRECPHGQAPSTFVVSSQSEAQFSDLVSQLTPSAAPHK